MGEAKRRQAAAISVGPWPGSDARCPSCLGLRVAAAPFEGQDFYGHRLAICADCGIAWEPIDEAHVWDRTDRYCSGKEPCDNCAFRPGSHEQEDRQKWQKLIASLKHGSGFYCHKGVPIDPGSEHGFKYPADRRQLPLCRGYLNAIGRWWKIPAATRPADADAPEVER